MHAGNRGLAGACTRNGCEGGGSHLGEEFGGASAAALHAGCAQDAQFGCAVGVLFEEVVLQVEQRFFAECLGEGVGAERVGLFGSIQHEARALYRCGGEVDNAAHAGALCGNGNHGGKQGVCADERRQILHIGCCEACCVDDDLCAGEGFCEGVDDAFKLVCFVDDAVYVEGSGCESRCLNGVDADTFCVQTRDDGGTNEAAGANDFPLGFGHLFYLSRARVRCGEKWGHFNFPIFEQFMGNLWGFIRSLVVFSHGVHSVNTGCEAGSLMDTQNWVCRHVRYADKSTEFGCLFVIKCVF